MKKITIFVSFVFILLFFPEFSCAGGLKMNYAEVLIQNLQIGSDYSMVEMGNLPLEITNKYYKDIYIQLEVLKPNIKKLKKDFEPIPDTGWININKNIVKILPKETYKTDVKISIPDNVEFLGKKYHVLIRSTVKPQGKGISLVLAVQGNLLFSVAPVKKSVSKQPCVDIGFLINPLRIELDNIQLGKKIEILTSDGKKAILKNPSNKKMKFKLYSLDPKDTVMKIESGYEACPSPDYLTFKREEISIGKGREKPIEMFLEIPDKPEYKGKRFQFLVSVSTGTATSGSRYLRVLVSTAKE
jgi:hypothetical protein